MYPITNEVMALFESEQRKVLRITGTDKNGATISITDNNVMADSFQIDRYACNGEKLEVGTAIAAQLTLKLENGNGQYDGIVFEGAELFVEVGIADWTQSSPTVTYIPCGYFTPDDQPRRLSTISITGLDRMTKFDVVVDATDLTFPTTIAGLVGQVCTLCGVTLAQSISGLVNAGVTVTELPTAQDEITYRNLIQWCAGIMGTNAWFDWNGQLRFSWYENATGYVSTVNNRYSSDLYEDDLTVSGVEYTNDSGIVIVEGTDDYAIDLTGNAIVGPLVATVLPPLNTALNGFTYRPFTAATVNAPYLWPMDIMTFTDKNGNNHTSALTNVAFGLNGTTAMESKGMTYAINKLAQPKGFTREQAQLVNQAMENVEQSIDANLTQQEIFNRLTDNGAAQGLLLYNGQLYVNASYIQAGTLTLGGLNNVNGEMRVLNSNGDEIGHWSNAGLAVQGYFGQKSIDVTIPTYYDDSGKVEIGSISTPIYVRIDNSSSGVARRMGINYNGFYVRDYDDNNRSELRSYGLTINRYTNAQTARPRVDLIDEVDLEELEISAHDGITFYKGTDDGQGNITMWDRSYINDDAGIYRNLYVGGATTMNGKLTFNKVTNAIAYTGTKATYDMIRFIDNTSDEYGNGIYIGGGGAAIIGGGESAATAAAQVTGGSEILYLCNDGDVNVFSNMQNGWNDRKTFTFGANGTLTAPAFSGPLTGNVTGNCSGSAGSVAWGNVTDKPANYPGGCTGNAATATNADKVDNYHAADLWRKDGGTWNGGANIACVPTAANQEYSFDLGNAYTGTYWQVWSNKNSATILACYNDDRRVHAPVRFDTAWLRVINNSSSNTDDAMVYLENKSSADWGLEVNCDGYDYGINVVTSNNAANAIVTNGNVKAGQFNGYTLSLSTENTSDTWVPVMTGSTLQHRVLQSWLNNMSTVAVGHGGTGSTSASGARTNLGIYGGSASVSFTNGVGTISFGTVGISSRPNVFIAMMRSSSHYYWFIYDYANSSSGIKLILCQGTSKANVTNSYTVCWICIP